MISFVRRRLFNFAAAISLVLCAGTAALWVRSYWANDIVYRDQLVPTDPPVELIEMRTRVASVHGMLVLSRSRATGSYPEQHEIPLVGFHWLRQEPVDFDDDGSVKSIPRMLGFGFQTHQSQRGSWRWDIWMLRLPEWLLAITFAALPAVGLVQFRRDRRRRHAGHCQSCGYDLRATPNRCPECGTVPSPAPLPAMVPSPAPAPVPVAAPLPAAAPVQV
jgi:hypothetical protein